MLCLRLYSVKNRVYLSKLLLKKNGPDLFSSLLFFLQKKYLTFSLNYFLSFVFNPTKRCFRLEKVYKKKLVTLFFIILIIQSKH